MAVKKKAHKVAKATKSSSKEVEEGKAFAFLGIFLGIIGFVIVLLTKKDNSYAMYYAKQGLVLTIAWFIAMAISFVTMFILIGIVLAPILYILMFVLWVIGIVYSLSGEKKPIPIIGKYAEHFKI